MWPRSGQPVSTDPKNSITRYQAVWDAAAGHLPVPRRTRNPGMLHGPSGIAAWTAADLRASAAICVPHDSCGADLPVVPLAETLPSARVLLCCS